MNAGVEGVKGDDGELRPTGLGVAFVPDDQLPSQMVECGPEVVNDIPDNGAPPEWWPFPDFEPHEVLAGLGLEIVDGFIRLAPRERLCRTCSRQGVCN